MEVLKLLLEDGENVTGRFASLELCGEWMGKKIVFCTFLI
jgi:hypothetical protein